MPNSQETPLIICPYCDKDAVIADSAEVYGGRSYGMIWLCRPCNAYVGTHKNSARHAPLGRLANAELREWKKRAHAAFDPIWLADIETNRVSKSVARKSAYQWLTRSLGIEYRDCHIGMFDVDLCTATVAACRDRLESQTQRSDP